MHEALLTREILGADETRWPLLGSKSQTRWHAWALCAPDAVVYRIQEGRDTRPRATSSRTSEESS